MCIDWQHVKNMGHVQKSMMYDSESGEVMALIIADREPIEAILFLDACREEKRYFIDNAHAQLWCERSVHRGSYHESVPA